MSPRLLLLAFLCLPFALPAWGGQQDPSAVLLRFAVLGDAEPKPEPVFPGLRAAVADINRLAGGMRLDFVVGVGDIAHKGTLLQYEAATVVLADLTRPFYPIMGNEEHGSTVDRFLAFATRWNRGKVAFPAARYVVDTDAVALVFASPDSGRDFNDESISWVQQEIRRRSGKPVILIVHGAQTGVFPEQPEKGVSHPGFAGIVAQENLAAVISGDLHMDMDRVNHSKQIGHVHYLHIPGLERTKIPDETRHEPMFRVFTLYGNGRMVVDTYRTGVAEPLARHAYGFVLPGSR